MFNYSEIEAQGQERLNAMHCEARDHNRVKHPESPSSRLGSLLIRTGEKLVSFANPEPTINPQPNPECC